MHPSTAAAAEAFRRGYTPIPVKGGSKRPHGQGWPHLRWETEDALTASFEKWAEDGATNLGLLLGEPSGGLVDVDLDHPKAVRLRDHFVPRTMMRTGRASRPGTHRWFIATGTIPETRKYTLPNGDTTVELRSTGAQTVIPPSVHESGQEYVWETAQPWGKPAEIDGRKLALQIGMLGMGAILLDVWPKQGSRHDAYLALAGGLLRFGDDIHPYWEKNLPILIRALAVETGDEDGAETRIHEVMGTTRKRLSSDSGKAVGFPRLAEIIGNDSAELVRRRAKDVEALAGFSATPTVTTPTEGTAPDHGASVAEPDPDPDEIASTLPPEQRDPLAERENSWAAVDLAPYLAGDIQRPTPTVLSRTDGHGLMYAGKVNLIFGLSESAKSWIALFAASQEISKGDRAMYLDLEDDPFNTVYRAVTVGIGSDDLIRQFRYIRPEGPIAAMQRYRYGAAPTEAGIAASNTFQELLKSYDPTVLIVDGINALYGLHGHDTNDASSTDVVTSWLKSLCRGGRTTVIAIDHTGKAGGAGASPMGSHHKIAMVQGTALRIDVVDRPMDGHKGHVRAVIFKDRPGAVREHSGKQQASEQVAGEVWIDSRDKGKAKISILPPDASVISSESPDMEGALSRIASSQQVQEDIMSMFGGDLDRGLSTREVAETCGHDPKDIRAAWGRLERDKIVRRIGGTSDRRYVLDLPEDPGTDDAQEGE